jgi:hypothetical protein
MSMNRGDYETLSAAIADSAVGADARRTLAFDMADALVPTNARFDPVLWLRDCNVGTVHSEHVEQWSTPLARRVDTIRKKRARYEEESGKRLGRY